MNRKKPIEYALYLLKLRDRSSGEIREKMKRKSFTDEEIDATIENLNEKGLIDDERFIKHYLKNQRQLKPQGKYKLKMKLVQLHLENDLILEALNKIEPEDEVELAEIAGKKWLNRKEKLPVEEKKVKLARYLAGRGFGWEIISRTLHNLRFDI